MLCITQKVNLITPPWALLRKPKFSSHRNEGLGFKLTQQRTATTEGTWCVEFFRRRDIRCVILHLSLLLLQMSVTPYDSERNVRGPDSQSAHQARPRAYYSLLDGDKIVYLLKAHGLPDDTSKFYRGVVLRAHHYGRLTGYASVFFSWTDSWAPWFMFNENGCLPDVIFDREWQEANHEVCGILIVKVTESAYNPYRLHSEGGFAFYERGFDGPLPGRL